MAGNKLHISAMTLIREPELLICVLLTASTNVGLISLYLFHYFVTLHLSLFPLTLFYTVVLLHWMLLLASFAIS